MVSRRALEDKHLIAVILESIRNTTSVTLVCADNQQSEHPKKNQIRP